jgi:hypothetical protein
MTIFQSLIDFYPGIFAGRSWAGHVFRIEGGRSSFKILTGKASGKRPFGKPRRKCKDNIRMYLNALSCLGAIFFLRIFFRRQQDF